MRIAMNETDLWFDVVGGALIPDGPIMRERPVVVVLHGGPGLDHAYLRPELDRLATTAQLVYLDLRGHGRSTGPPLATCTAKQMADDVALFCQTLGIERPVVLGHSFGGTVALLLALCHPQLTGRLILVDTTACWDADTAEAMTLLDAWHGPEVRHAARLLEGDTSPEAAAEFARIAFPTYVWDPALRPSVMAAVGRCRIESDLGDAYWSTEAPAYDLRSRLVAVSWPTLVVVGDRDWRTPPSAARTLAAGIPGARLVTFPNVGHFPYAEAPAAFVDAVTAFLAETAATS